MPPYQSLKRFVSLLHAFHSVERIAGVPTLNRRTNGPEHTYQLAMAAWYLISSQKLDLNLEKVLLYALAHDIVEAYAGDTPTFDTEGRKTKDAREREAFERICSEFPEFPELATVLTAYEERHDAESKFVYSLDKIIDPLNSVMTSDRPSVWHEFNVDYTAHHEYKDTKARTSEHIEPLWEALSKELKDNEDFFFPKR